MPLKGSVASPYPDLDAMNEREPAEVMSELLAVSRELVRLGDDGSNPGPSRLWTLLRARRDALRVEVRNGLRGRDAAWIEPPRTVEACQTAPTRRPPVSETRLRAHAPTAETYAPDRRRAGR